MEDKMIEPVGEGLFDRVVSILDQARTNVVRAVNSNMVIAYWLIGREIVEHIQGGEQRAEYGQAIIKTLSKQLNERYKKGFSLTNLKTMRLFYLAFNQLDKKGHTLCGFLSWSHFKHLIRVENEAAREWYMNEAVKCNWSVRALERQIGTLYYERLLASNDRPAVESEAEDNTRPLIESPREVIRDPYILDFLGLPGSGKFLESEFEQALMDHLQSFLLELGRGFAFVGRQERISTETKDFFIDLVFYNFRLKCFVIIDLKRGELTHQDIGQMDMYVRMYDELRKDDSDNPTVGIVLCTGADESVVHYSVMKESERLFASKYKLILPNEEELRAELERERKSLEQRSE